MHNDAPTEKVDDSSLGCRFADPTGPDPGDLDPMTLNPTLYFARTCIFDSNPVSIFNSLTGLSFSSSFLVYLALLLPIFSSYSFSVAIDTTYYHLLLIWLLRKQPSMHPLLFHTYLCPSSAISRAHPLTQIGKPLLSTLGRKYPQLAWEHGNPRSGS